MAADCGHADGDGGLGIALLGAMAGDFVMEIDWGSYRLIVIDLASVIYRDNGRFQMMPPVRQWLAEQPLRAPDQKPFIAVVEYLPIAVGSGYESLAARLTKGLRIDGARSVYGSWPSPELLYLCQRLYGVGPSLLLGNSRLNLVAAEEAGFEFCFVQALFPVVPQVQAGDETAVWCARCGPGTRLVVDGKKAARLRCPECGYRTDAPESLKLLNEGAPRLL